MFCIGCSSKIGKEKNCPYCGLELRNGEMAGAFRRFAARYLIDFSLFFIFVVVLVYAVCCFCIGICALDISLLWDCIFWICLFIVVSSFFQTPILLLFLLVDTLVYRITGNTLGRYLLGIKIVDLEGNAISAKTYLKRNFKWFTSACWLGILPAIPFFINFCRVSHKKFSTYDQKLKVQVLLSEINLVKIIVGYFLVLILPILLIGLTCWAACILYWMILLEFLGWFGIV